jgi:hypothetical protein
VLFVQFQQDIEMDGALPVVLRKLTIRGGCGLDSKCKLDARSQVSSSCYRIRSGEWYTRLCLWTLNARWSLFSQHKLFVVGANDRVRGSLTLSGLHLTNAYTYDNTLDMEERGAAVQVQPNATAEILQCVFSQNHAAGNLAAGGALDVRIGGFAYITDSHFTDNHADKAGGAIVASGVIEVRDGCTFNGNFQGTNFKLDNDIYVVEGAVAISATIAPPPQV